MRASDNDALDVAVLMLGDEWLKDVEISISKGQRAVDGRLPRAQRVNSRQVPNRRYTLHIDIYDFDGNLSGRDVNVWVKNPAR